LRLIKDVSFAVEVHHPAARPQLAGLLMGIVCTASTKGQENQAIATNVSRTVRIMDKENNLSSSDITPPKAMNISCTRYRHSVRLRVHIRCGRSVTVGFKSLLLNDLL